MRFITWKRVESFIQNHPESRNSFERWGDIIRRAEFDSFNSVKNLFPHADRVGKLIVFNVGGNNYRVVAAIAYAPKIVYIRKVMTHAEYSKNFWKKDPWPQE